MDNADESYRASVLEHARQCLEELEALRTAAMGRNWTHLEYRAAERLLQILIESAIGYAKQWIRRTGRQIPSDAYSSFERLAELQVLTEAELKTWKKIIGLRNALVHDYLNLKREVIKTVVDQQGYRIVNELLSKPWNDLHQGK